MQGSSLIDHVIKLVEVDWEDGCTVEEKTGAVVAPVPWHDGITNDILENVGWMYLSVPYQYVDIYISFLEWDWDDLYQRPPYVQCSMWKGFDKQKWFPHHGEFPEHLY